MFNDILKSIEQSIINNKSELKLDKICSCSNAIKTTLLSPDFKLNFQNHEYTIVPEPEINLIFAQTVYQQGSDVPDMRCVKLNDQALTKIPGLMLTICHI